MKVDLGAVLRDKNPAAARWIPRFVISWLERTVHQGEINGYLAEFGHLPAIGFARACLAKMGITYRIEGLEALDPGGRYLFASNHPFGGVDGLMLADKITERFGEGRIIVNDILMNLTPLAPIFVPINKHGSQNPAYARALNDAFASSMPLVTFPAGLCSRRIAGVVQDPPWKNNFVKKAVAYDRAIVPVFCEGELSSRFYNLALWRKRLGVKVNIEMLFLPDEMFRQQGRSFTIRVGKPVSATELATASPQEWSRRIREMVYSMR